jgi:hypothetical protein
MVRERVPQPSHLEPRHDAPKLAEQGPASRLPVTAGLRPATTPRCRPPAAARAASNFDVLGRQLLQSGVFYACVSTRDQQADLQLDAARKRGIPTEDIFVETASGKRDDRPVLNHVLAEVLQPGDTLVC